MSDKNIAYQTFETLQGKIANLTRVDSNTTLDSTHEIILCDTDGGTITIILPAGVEGTHYRISNVGTSGNDVTIDANGSETVYGSLTQTLSDGEVLNLYFNSVEGWF